MSKHTPGPWEAEFQPDLHGDVAGTPNRDPTPDGPRVWVEDRGWRVPSQYRVCRHRGCPNAPVADLFRRQRRRPGWWAYCAEHLYGRRVEGGKVLTDVHPDSPAARAGYTGEHAPEEGSLP